MQVDVVLQRYSSNVKPVISICDIERGMHVIVRNLILRTSDIGHCMFEVCEQLDRHKDSHGTSAECESHRHAFLQT